MSKAAKAYPTRLNRDIFSFPELQKLSILFLVAEESCAMSGSVGEQDERSAPLPITNEEYFIPFGNYTGSGTEDGQGPLLGRGSLRSQLIRSLVFGGQKLAYLITGRRGMGKTSFVRHCLTEYEKNAFERFRRTAGGKSLIDLMVVFALITLIAGATVLVSRVSHMFLSDHSNAIARILGMGLALCLAGIFVFALTYGLRSHIRPGQHWLSKISHGVDIAIGMSFVVCLLYWFRDDDKVPVLIAGQFIVASLLFQWMTVGRDNIANSCILTAPTLIYFPYTVTSALIYFSPGFPREFLSELSCALSATADGMGLADSLNVAALVKYPGQIVRRSLLKPMLPLLSVALTIGLVHCITLTPLDYSSNGSKHKTQKIDWFKYFASISIFAALATATTISAKSTYQNEFVSYFIICIGAWSTLIILSKCTISLLNPKNIEKKFVFKYFRPIAIAQAQAVFRAKSVFFLAAALYLFMSTGAPNAIAQIFNGIAHTKAGDLTYQRVHLILKKCVLSKDGIDNLAKQQVPAKTNDLANIAVLSIVAMMFAVLELKVIGRSIGAFNAHLDLAGNLTGHSKMAETADVNEGGNGDDGKKAQAVEQALPEDKPPLDPYLDSEIEEWCRRLEQMTLSWHIYKLYVQPIVVHVNLGFDDLRHSSVIHGMLVGLRDEYRRTFVEWNSHLGTVLRLTGGILVLSIIAAISSSSFFVDKRHFVAGGINCGERNGDGKVRQGIGGAIPSFLCLIDESTRLASAVYMPLIPLLNSSKYHTDSVLLNWVRGEAADDVEVSTTEKAIDDKQIAAAKIAFNDFLIGRGKLHELNQSLSTNAPYVYLYLTDGIRITNPETLTGIARDIEDFNLKLQKKYEAEIAEFDKQLSDLKDKTAGKRQKGIAAAEKRVDDSKKKIETLAKSYDDLASYRKWLRSADLDFARPAIRVYHITLLILLIAAMSWVGDKLPLLPYRRNLRQMESLLDSLTAKTVREHSRAMWDPARWVHSMVSKQERLTVESQPVDPRAVEAAFITILRDLANAYWPLPGGRLMRLGVPTVEITFVFDEMDKLWAKGGIHPTLAADKDQRADKGQRAAKDELGGQEDERKRALLTARLLSDLKRVISDSPARFIFVGGRALHDEWLADMHSGTALLTSIFDAEIYLPSMLTDTQDEHYQSRSKVQLGDMVGSFLRRRHRIAIFSQYARQREVERVWPWFARRSERKLRFLQVDGTKGDMKVMRRSSKGSHADYHGLPLPMCWQERLIRQLEAYLAYRSAGNPKRLQEMLGDLIRPYSRIRADHAAPPHLRSDEERSGEIVCLNPPAILRIQFVSEVLDHLKSRLEGRLLHRDDKIVLSTFYLTDYLFKFHRRAFGWHNIERIEEFTNIHRAPDIRDLLLEIVDHFSHRYLLRVVNGMYDLRFRSDVAQELSYISQYSKGEMAAFNFTLDESLGMKTSFNAAMADNTLPSIDLVAGLGELYEYDQEYDTARQHYRRALRIADEELHNLVAGVGPHKDSGAIDGMLGRILDDDSSGHPYPRIPLSWALSRLRLMLQVGMTYEQAGNFERAEGEYVAAHHLARKFLSYFLAFDYANPSLWEASVLAPEGETLKHASLLYQPIFAIAWNAEKLWSDIDTSLTTVEKSLRELRQLMPFVKDGEIGLSVEPHLVKNSGFALIASDLHNKAGDLLFFKGRQYIEWSQINKYVKTGRRIVDSAATKKEIRNYSGGEGYLMRAHHHYCMALHELRRFSYHRKQSSRHKLNIQPAAWPTLGHNDFPFFIHLAAAGIITNLAEGILSRISTSSLLMGMSEIALAPSTDPDTETEAWVTKLQSWLGCCNEGANNLPAPKAAAGSVDFGNLSAWLGTWEEKESARLSFPKPHHAEYRLLLSLNLSRAGAEIRAIDGHYEDAASEMLMVCQTICRYLWTFRLLKATALDTKLPTEAAAAIKETSPNQLRYRKYLVAMGFACLKKAYSWRELASGGNGHFDKTAFRPENIVSAEAITLACSLALAAPNDEVMLVDLQKLIAQWQVPTTERPKKDAIQNHGEPNHNYFRTQLLQSLLLRRYPVLNRINGLKVLIDSMITDEVWTIEDGLPKSEPVKAIALLREYIQLFNRFNAPHIAPFSGIGHTVAFYYLKTRGMVDENVQHKNLSPQLRGIARKFLSQAIGTYTLGDEYYAMIRRLYYLYDDFNDRLLHYARAAETSQWDISCILQASVEERAPVTSQRVE